MTSVIGFIMTLAFCGLASAHEGHQAPAGHLVFKNNTLHVHADFAQGPTVGGESILVLSAKNPADHSATAFVDNVSVELWMPSMGHGSAPTQVERVVDAQGNVVNSQFRVRNVYFVMGGDWDVRVTLTSANGTKETQKFSLVLGGNGGGGHHH